MHVWFRQYAQQMGMQNVRAILPEQIDNLINTATLDIIDEVINKNVGTTNDRIITDNAKLASVNALRTLYRVQTISVSSLTNGNTANPATFSSTIMQPHLYIVDFAIQYTIGSDNDGPILSKWFPVRIIDDAYLADVLNDWVLSPRMRSPIIVMYSTGGVTTNVNMSNGSGTVTHTITANTTGTELNTVFELYVGELKNSKTIANIRCSYIRKPNEVQYGSDIGGANVSSDLPLQLQIPMLKHAVDLYRASISGSLFATQQQNENQQREMVRNNARPDNEGYQS